MVFQLVTSEVYIKKTLSTLERGAENTHIPPAKCPSTGSFSPSIFCSKLHHIAFFFFRLEEIRQTDYYEDAYTIRTITKAKNEKKKRPTRARVPLFTYSSLLLSSGCLSFLLITSRTLHTFREVFISSDTKGGGGGVLPYVLRYLWKERYTRGYLRTMYLVPGTNMYKSCLVGMIP